MKNIFYTIIFLGIFTNANAGNDKTVTLITSGQGRTQDEAKQSALRNAIEQSFGAFISHHTEVLNDELIKDEIISVGNGNIQKYEVLSESALPDNGGYTNTLKVTVSVSKLTSFCESKGMSIEIKGSLFAFNVIQKELAASNESKALEELVVITKNLAPKVFDYNLLANEPVKNEIGSYSLPVKVTIIANKNWEALFNIIYKTLNSLALPSEELNDNAKLNIQVNTINLLSTKTPLNGRCIYFPQEPNRYSSYPIKEIDTKGFDKMSWDAIYGQQKGNQLPARGFVVQKMFKPSNYKLSILSFRNNINTYLSQIQSILRNEQNNWAIQAGTTLNIDYSTHGSMNKSNNIHSRAIDLIGFPSDFGSTQMGGAKMIYNVIGSEDYLGFNNKSNTIFIHNVEPNATIGFAYANILLSLDQIKNLSKLEVKHRE